MSTRSHLRFIRPDQDDASPEKPSGVAQVYKHSDGYPSAVIHLLVELTDLLHATHTLRGPTHAAAQFIFIDTCSVMPLYLPSDAELDESRTIDAALPRDAVDPSQMRESAALPPRKRGGGSRDRDSRRRGVPLRNRGPGRSEPGLAEFVEYDDTVYRVNWNN